MANNNSSPDGLGETRLYRVTMVVAVHPLYCDNGHPNIEEAPEGVVLYAATGGFDDMEGVQIVGEPQVHELVMTLATPAVAKTAIAPATIKAEVAQATLPDDEDSVVEALQAATPAKAPGLAKATAKRKKHKKKYQPRKADVLDRERRVLEVLHTLGNASADDIADLEHMDVKKVYYALYHLHANKQVSAVKTAGKVRWFANTSATNNNETK